MNSISRPIGLLMMCLASAWVTNALHAQDLAPGSAVSAARLDAIRGGIDFGGGLLGSFGISRATYINGQLVAHSQVTIPDIAHVTAPQAMALAAATQPVVIHNGSGNFVDPTSFNGPAATVIQNTLNDQNIQNLTTIQASVNTLPDFNALHLQEGLQAGLVQSLGH